MSGTLGNDSVYVCIRPSRSPLRNYTFNYSLSFSEVLDRQHLRHANCRFHVFATAPLEAAPFSLAGSAVWNSLPDDLCDQAVDSEHFRLENIHPSIHHTLRTVSTVVAFTLSCFITNIDLNTSRLN